METETRLIVTCCHQFVVGFVVIDPVIVVKFTFHPLCCPVCDAEPGNWSDLQQYLAEHLCDVFKNGVGDASMEQAQVRGGAEGGSEREVLRRLVEVLATLSSVNAAELRELTAIVFKTYLVPCAEPVAVAMAEAGRFYHETTGAIKDRPRDRNRRGSRTARSPVRARVGGVPAQLDGNEKGWRQSVWRR